MAYFTFEHACRLEPSQTQDICLEPSFHSNPEWDVFQHLLYPRVSHNTYPTARSTTGFIPQCFTMVLHTFLNNTLEGQLN